MAQGGREVNEPTVDGADWGRLRVTERHPDEHIDGAWWPRSMDLVAELPGLLAALAPQLGRVVMVGYLRDDWSGTPPRAEIMGQTVELLGFDSAEPSAVIVVGHGGHHLTLRVIPSWTGEQAARQALDAVPASSGGGSVGSMRAKAQSLADIARRLAAHEGRGDDQRNADIMRWCEEAAEQFDNAPIQSYVPVLVEHIVRTRMSQDRPIHGSRSAESRNVLAEGRTDLPEVTGGPAAPSGKGATLDGECQ